MIHTQTQIDNLIELAIIQRVELKKLVESLPELRTHLSVEIERNLNEIEPLLREELQTYLLTSSQAEHAKLGNALKQKIAELAVSLEDTTAAKFSVLMAERAENDTLLAKAEARIAEAASALPAAVKEIVTDELSRFPRAGEIDQLRKEFAEPKGLNPRGKWTPGETYQRLDLVTWNGDSFVSNIDGNRERPSRSAADWTLNAARGNSGGGGGVTSITDLLPIPSSGQILGSEGPNYVPKTLVAGSNITITETPTTITITGDEGQIELQDGTEAAPSLFFVNDTNTGLYRPTADTVGIVGGGHDILRLTDVASATDYLEIKNGIGVGSPLHVVAEGASANIGVHLQPKGSGLFTISDGTDFNKGIRFRSSSSSASAVTLIDAVSTAGRVVTLPDATDTLVGRSTTDTLSNKTMIAPALGTPTALIGTNITGTAAGLTAGNVTTNANLTGDVTSVGNATSIASGVIVNADVNASAAIAYSKLNLATSIVDADISAAAAIVDTKLATISTASKVSNSATTATSANTASAIVARDASGNFTAGTITANLTGNVSGSSGSTTGNAATATALQTARAINGVNFDGTAAITVAAAAGTLTGTTLASNVTASSLTSVGTLGSLTVTNPITGSVTGSSGSTTGNAATATALATGRTIAITGDIAYTSPSFDGTGNVTAAGTLATVATPGSTGGSTAIPIITINAKGLTTSITTAAVIAPAGTLSGNTLAAGVTASSLTSLGTIANLTATAGTISTTPTASTDIANKLYVDTVAQGLDAKASCVAATTADITLTGAQTIDGVSVVAGNRVLVKNQSLSQNNGLYLCASGSWTRTTDANTWDALTSAFTFIEQGTVNGDCGFVCTANAGGTLGTTALPWSQFSGAGTFTAGTGLTLTGSVFSLTSPVAVANGGTGLTSLGSGVATFLGTPSSANLLAAVSDETGSGSLVFANSPTLVTPALGTPSALVGTNITGTASGLTAGNVTTNANLTGAITSVGNATSLGSFTSANLAAALTDETGSGAAVFATSPTLTTPILGTPASGNLANCTFPTLNQNTTGSAATLTTARAIYGNNFDGSAALTQAIAGTYGGTGVNNGANTITLAGNVTHAGAFTQTFTATANTSLTLPVTGTLATLAGSEALSNKTITASAFNGTVGATTRNTVAATTGNFQASGGAPIILTGNSSAQIQLGGTGATDPSIRYDAAGVLGVVTADQSAYAKIRALDFNGTIGATTPSTGAFTTLSASGDTTLGQNLTLQGGASGALIKLNANAGVTQQVQFQQAGTNKWQLYYETANGNLSLYDSTNATNRWSASSTGLAVTGKLTSTGNFGTGTSSPICQFQCTPAVNAVNPSLGTAQAGSIFTSSSGLYGLNIGVTNAGYSLLQSMRFDGTATAYDIVLQPSGGNVGIGTASPYLSRLHIQKSESGSTPAAVLRVSNSGAGYTSKIVLTDENTNDANISYIGANQFLGFGIGTSLTQMVLTSTGNLLVGTTSTIDVGKISLLFDSSSQNGISVKTSSSTYNNNLMSFVNAGGSQVGYIYTNGTITTYSGTSDYRLKDITGPLTDSGTFIDALKPKVGTWKSDGSKFVGFLAHEFAEVSPSSVNGEKDAVDAEGNPKYQGMQAGTAEVIANLVAELQSVRQRLAALEA